MARKPKHEEHENHERWLVSYADFITLLFAFFVVMYSISSVNEGKYRVLSSSLVTAFSHPQRTVEPIQYGTPLRTPIIQHDSVVKDQNSVSRVGVDHRIMPSSEEMADMQKIADEIEHYLKDLIDKNLITVTKTNLGVEIEIKSNVLFASGVAVLSSQAISPLRKIAAVLEKTSNDINVEGYTDNVPIRTQYFPSNWELSAARAASVVRLFARSGIDPSRLKAIGFGEFEPIADNSTEFGRSKNRRVAIMVLNKPEEKRISVGLNKDVKDTDTFAARPKGLDNKLKSLPITKLGGSDIGNVNQAAPKLLPARSSKPAITTLPLGNATVNSPTESVQGAGTQRVPRKEKDSFPAASEVIVKPADPINLPVLQALPKEERGQN